MYATYIRFRSTCIVIVTSAFDAYLSKLFPLIFVQKLFLDFEIATLTFRINAFMIAQFFVSSRNIYDTKICYIFVSRIFQKRRRFGFLDHKKKFISNYNQPRTAARFFMPTRNPNVSRAITVVVSIVFFPRRHPACLLCLMFFRNGQGLQFGRYSNYVTSPDLRQENQIMDYSLK